MPSPPVMYILLGSAGLMTVRWTSVSMPWILVKVCPPSVLFCRPPTSMPINIVLVSSGWKLICLV